MLDEVEIEVSSGDGGSGAVSFRREKFVPRGGPDGGDGGDGGAVHIVADSSLMTMLPYQRTHRYRAEDGGKGSGSQRYGRRGADLNLKVPVGTIVSRFVLEEGGYIAIADLIQDGERLKVLAGGRGGRGNASFATATRKAPEIAQRGQRGETARLRLELKVLADVGLVGLPNAGKSTLLAAMTAAKPKIAPYPFTTLEPNLGVVETERQAPFITADIPGLIEGAHQGRGLGHRFLRHIERTRVLVHVVDGMVPELTQAVEQVDHELALYNPVLARRPQIIAINKVDLPEVLARLPLLEAELRPLQRRFYFISAATGFGTTELLQALHQELETAPLPEPPVHLPALPKASPRPLISLDAGAYVVHHPVAERLASQWDLRQEEARAIFRRQLARLGVVRALRREGCQAGDRVRLGEVEWEWE